MAVAGGMMSHSLAQEEVVKAKLLPVGLSSSVTGLYFINGSKPVELRASMTGFGAGIDYEGPRVFSVYATSEELMVRDGREKPVPLASVRLPADAERIMLAIVAGKNGAKPKLRAFGVSTKGFRTGDYRFYNFSKSKVAVILGEKKIGLSPGGVETVNSAQWRDEVMDLPVKLGQQKPGGKPRVVYSSVWGHQPKQRNMIMVFDGGTRAKPLEVRRYYDVPGVKKEQDS